MIDKSRGTIRDSSWFCNDVTIGINPKLRSMSRFSEVCLSSLYVNKFSLKSPRTYTSCPLVLSCSNCFFRVFNNYSSSLNGL